VYVYAYVYTLKREHYTGWGNKEKVTLKSSHLKQEKWERRKLSIFREFSLEIILTYIHNTDELVYIYIKRNVIYNNITQKERLLNLPHTASMTDKLAGTKRNLTNIDTMAFRIMTRSLNHFTITDIDSNVMDLRSRRTEENKITSLSLADFNLVLAVTVLSLSVMSKGMTSTLINRVFRKTTAIETLNITIITIRRFSLLHTISSTIIVTTTPAVRPLSNLAFSS